MRNRGTRYFTMFVGSLLALAIVSAQLNPVQVGLSSEHKAEKNKAGAASNEAVITLPSFSLPSPVTIAPYLHTHCLFEILFEKEPTEAVEIFAVEGPRKLLVTLFRVIISPNAP